MVELLCWIIVQSTVHLQNKDTSIYKSLTCQRLVTEYGNELLSLRVPFMDYELCLIS